MAINKSIYSHDLGLDLSTKDEEALARWFLACLLFGKPIQQQVAKRTYETFVHYSITTPQAILDAGWDRLVQILDEGHYVRYDFSTADKLLAVMKELLEKYHSIKQLLETSPDKQTASARLQAFKGVGKKTTEIFLRDITPVYYQK